MASSGVGLRGRTPTDAALAAAALAAALMPSDERRDPMVDERVGGGECDGDGVADNCIDDGRVTPVESTVSPLGDTVRGSVPPSSTVHVAHASRRS